MGNGAVMRKGERVLLVGAQSVALRAAQRVVAAGGEAVVVTSVFEARRVRGTFDRGVFDFDLPDGSGIALAAEMLLEDRIREVCFLHPREELAAREEYPSGVRSTSRQPSLEKSARSVA